jgi:hypothetical protein
MLVITPTQADAISAIDRTRTDGGLGVIYDGSALFCRDVRQDPHYAAYHLTLQGAIPGEPQQPADPFGIVP